MENAVLGTLTNGPEAFSPDGQWILGQAHEVQNYYVAAAMRSIGAGAAGGVGDAIANYIADGKYLRKRLKHLPFPVVGLDANF